MSDLPEPARKEEPILAAKIELRLEALKLAVRYCGHENHSVYVDEVFRISDKMLSYIATGSQQKDPRAWVWVDE